jgi:hypothetical protein
MVKVEGFVVKSEKSGVIRTKRLLRLFELQRLQLINIILF